MQVQYKFWSNDAFNALGPTLVTSFDPKARYTAFQNMLDIYDWEDPPGTVLYTVGMFYAQRKDFHWRPYPVEQMDFRRDAFAADPVRRKL